MGDTGNPTVLGAIVGFLCILPWLLMVISALRDAPRRKAGPEPYREIPPRDMQDERAGFIESTRKLEKIERAMR